MTLRVPANAIYTTKKLLTSFVSSHPRTIGYHQPPTKPTEKNNPRHSTETFPLPTMEHPIGEPDYGCPTFFQLMGGFLLTFLIIVVLLSIHALGSWTWYLTPIVVRAIGSWIWYLTPIVVRAVCRCIAHCISTLCSVLHKTERVLFVTSYYSTFMLQFATGLPLLLCRLLVTFVYISTGLIVIVIVVYNAILAVRCLRLIWTERYGKAEKTK
jgi:hypothetical protein